MSTIQPPSPAPIQPATVPTAAPTLKQHAFYLFMGLCLAGVTHLAQSTLGSTFIWLVITPLVWLYFLNVFRKNEEVRLTQGRAERRVIDGLRNAQERADLAARAEVQETMEAKDLEIRRLGEQLDERWPSWDELRGWKDHIGFVTTDMGVPADIRRPHGFLMVMKKGDRWPLIYFLDHNMRYVPGTDLAVEITGGFTQEGEGVFAGSGQDIKRLKLGAVNASASGDVLYVGAMKPGAALRALDTLAAHFPKS